MKFKIGDIVELSNGYENIKLKIIDKCNLQFSSNEKETYFKAIDKKGVKYTVNQMQIRFICRKSDKCKSCKDRLRCITE